MKKFFKDLIIKYVKTYPITIIIFFIGLFIGSFISQVVGWIPLIGAFLSFFITLFFGVLHVYLLRKFFPNIK